MVLLKCTTLTKLKFIKTHMTLSSNAIYALFQSDLAALEEWSAMVKYQQTHTVKLMHNCNRSKCLCPERCFSKKFCAMKLRFMIFLNI